MAFIQEINSANRMRLALSTLLAASAAAWFWFVARADGTNWIIPRLNQVLPCAWYVAGLVAAALVTGLAIGWSTVVEKRRPAAFAASGVLSVGLLVFLQRLAHSPVLAGVPDWFCVSAMVAAGGLYAGGYGWVQRHGKARPVWPLLVLPVLIGTIAALNTGNLGDLIAVVGILILSPAIGQATLRIIGRELKIPFEIAAALGIALLILIFRVVGGLGGAGSVSILMVLTVLVVIARREIAQITAQLSKAATTPCSLALSAWVILGAGVFLALVFWFSTLAPETGADATGSRSAMPLIWERLGNIAALREIFTSYMGIGGETLNLVALPLAGENMAKVTTFASALFLTIAIARVPTSTGPTVPWLVALIFFGSTVVAWQFIHGFVDLHVAYLTVASMLAFEAWLVQRRNIWMVIAGLVAGSAVATKLHAGTMLVLFPCLILYGSHPPGRRILGSIRPLAALTLGVLIGLVPSLIRSYMLTDNPVFPFANSIFQSPLADLDLGKRLPSYGSGLNLRALSLPFRAVLNPTSLNELGTFHPAAWLLALNCILVLPWASSSARRWWLLSAAFWLGWVLTEQNLRYSIPALACTAVAMARTYSSLPASWNPRSWALIVIAAIGGFLSYARPTAWIWAEISGPALPRKLLVAEQSADQFRAIYLPSSAVSRLVNATYGKSAVIWQIPFLRDHQSFLGKTIAHPHGDLALLAPLYSILPDQPGGSSEDSIYRVLRNSGITHLMWDNLSPWIRGLPESGWTGLFSVNFSEKYLRLESGSGHNGFVRLYRVLPENEITESPLPAKREPAVAAETAVSAESLIGVQADWSSPLPFGGFFDMIWWSADRRLIYFERIPLDFASPAGWHRRWHTVPEGATSLQVFKPAGMDTVSLSMVEPGKK